MLEDSLKLDVSIHHAAKALHASVWLIDDADAATRILSADTTSSRSSSDLPDLNGVGGLILTHLGSADNSVAVALCQLRNNSNVSDREKLARIQSVLATCIDKEQLTVFLNMVDKIALASNNERNAILKILQTGELSPVAASGSLGALTLPTIDSPPTGSLPSNTSYHEALDNLSRRYSSKIQEQASQTPPLDGRRYIAEVGAAQLLQEFLAETSIDKVKKLQRLRLALER
jgi:hypothetical protein